MAMKIEACYIVKNEAANLPRSLASLGDACDTLLVVDTGSTDDTVAIARAAGARVLSYTWQDDFAAARNYALAQATGDWLIFLDADEWFVHPLVRAELEAILTAPLTRENTRIVNNAAVLAGHGEIAAEPSLPQVADGVLVSMENLEDLQGNFFSEAHGFLRLMRRDPHLRYRGRIHEQLTYIGQPPRPLCLYDEPPALRLRHCGYAGTLSPEKSRRNLRLLQAEIAEHGMQPGYDYYLADCYQGLGDYAAAARHAAACIRGPVAMVGDGVHPYHVLLECLRQLGGREQEMLTWAGRGIAAFPQQPEFYAERGMTLCALGRLREARQDLIEALIRYEQGGPRPEGGYFYAQQAGHCAARLGEIMQLLGDAEEAATWYGLAGRYAPQDDAVQAKIRRWRDKV